MVVDERAFRFTAVSDLLLHDNMGQRADGSGEPAMAPRAVTATKTVAATAQTFELNFTDVLLFPSLPIVSASYSIALGAGFAQHAMRPPAGQLVRVETAVAVDATVTMTVSQANFTIGNGP